MCVSVAVFRCVCVSATYISLFMIKLRNASDDGCGARESAFEKSVSGHFSIFSGNGGWFLRVRMGMSG